MLCSVVSVFADDLSGGSGFSLLDEAGNPLVTEGGDKIDVEH